MTDETPGGVLSEKNTWIPTFVICGEKRDWCECVRPTGHDGAHKCDTGCGGSWFYDDDGEFQIVSLPTCSPGAGR